MTTTTRGGIKVKAALLRYGDTLDAADQVAIEFLDEQRVEFLAQAIRREHEHVAHADSIAIAQAYTLVDDLKRGRR